MTRAIPKTVSHRPSVERLHELFDLDVETGVILWRVAPCMSVRAGDVAGSVYPHDHTFYRRVSIDGVRYLAHVIVWAMTHDNWPDHGIDHEDRDGLNNAPSNLRRASNSQNGANRAPIEGCSSRFGHPRVRQVCFHQRAVGLSRRRASMSQTIIR